MGRGAIGRRVGVRSTARVCASLVCGLRQGPRYVGLCVRQICISGGVVSWPGKAAFFSRG
eukprot:4651619-Lingulodinium_polyedra.AAC.1